MGRSREIMVKIITLNDKLSKCQASKQCFLWVQRSRLSNEKNGKANQWNVEFEKSCRGPLREKIFEHFVKMWGLVKRN